MSNVVKLSGLPKKQPIDKWQELIDEQGESLLGRLYDQIKLADVDALEEDMPEEYSDCMIVGVIASLLVTITHTRNVVSSDALLKLVKHEIEGREAE